MKTLSVAFAAALAVSDVRAFSVDTAIGRASRLTSYKHSPAAGGMSVTNPSLVRPSLGPRGESFKTALQATSTPSSSKEADELDTESIVKYVSSIVIQMSAFTALFAGIDQLVPSFDVQIPFAANCVFFYVIALRSRLLNPLSNKRPPELGAISPPERIRPTWMPPGVVFPIAWLLVVGPLRAATSAMIVEQTGLYCNGAILALMLHLSIGDVFNTINNVEGRLGTASAVSGVIFLSAANAAYQYYQVLPSAGELLSIKLVWLAAATAIIVRTWQLNPDPTTGAIQPVLPMKQAGEPSKTKLVWFEQE